MSATTTVQANPAQPVVLMGDAVDLKKPSPAQNNTSDPSAFVERFFEFTEEFFKWPKSLDPAPIIKAYDEKCQAIKAEPVAAVSKGILATKIENIENSCDAGFEAVSTKVSVFCLYAMGALYTMMKAVLFCILGPFLYQDYWRQKDINTVVGLLKQQPVQTQEIALIPANAEQTSSPHDAPHEDTPPANAIPMPPTPPANAILTPPAFPALTLQAIPTPPISPPATPHTLSGTRRRSSPHPATHTCSSLHSCPHTNGAVNPQAEISQLFSQASNPSSILQAIRQTRRPPAPIRILPVNPEVGLTSVLANRMATMSRVVAADSPTLTPTSPSDWSTD